MHAQAGRGNLSPSLFLSTIALALLAGASVASARALTVATVIALPGWAVSVPVTLDGTNGTVATQNDISFDSTRVRIRATAEGFPDCEVNPALDKASSSFHFLPFGCRNNECVTVRAVIISTSQTTTIPDGQVYSCQIELNATTTPGNYVLSNQNAIASNAIGQSLAVTPQSGQVQVPTTCGCSCP